MATKLQNVNKTSAFCHLKVFYVAFDGVFDRQILTNYGYGRNFLHTGKWNYLTAVTRV